MSAPITGWPGCHVCTRAFPAVAAAGASGHLPKELEGALGRAGIGVGETDVGVDHADQGQMRKIMAFGHELRTDDEVAGAARARRAPRKVSVPPGKSDDRTTRSPERDSASSASRSMPGPQAVSESASWHWGQRSGRLSTWPQ